MRGPVRVPFLRHPLVRAAAALACFLAAAGVATTSPSSRVVLVSLDGLGMEALLHDPVGAELTHVHAIAARGVRARGLQPHTPSTTANTHAALWTGAWGNVNGISGNTMPVPPRSAHSVAERVSGFRADHLRAEPIWVTAARQGVRTVVQQASQSYPFLPASVGTDPSASPVVLNGYQTRVISQARVLRATDVERVPCTSGVPEGLACVSWTAGPLTFHGRFEGPTADDPLPRIRVTSPHAEGRVEARAATVEHEMPRGRLLARHFSDGLLVDRVGDVGPVMVYFRLFEVSPDGLDFVLYQTAIHELALHDGARDTRDDIRRLLREAGGFLGNAGGYLWERPQSPLGLPLVEGGDGTSERRYLETVEVAVRQSMAHSAWLWRRFDPRLFVVYTSFPDELDHRLRSLAITDPRYVPFRRWGYQLVDLTVGALAGLVTANDHLVFVSDHGLAPVTHDVRLPVALQQAGLLALDATGRLDATRTRVVPIRNCLLVHGTDWKGGIVPPDQRADVLARAIEVLRGITDPDTGRPVVQEVVSTAEERARFGFGGETGADACVGMAEGYGIDESSWQGPVVARRRLPRGDHNALATRAALQGVLVGAGPRLPRGRVWPALRAIDVAPLVSDLLGIAPPADAQGRSPLGGVSDAARRQ